MSKFPNLRDQIGPGICTRLSMTRTRNGPTRLFQGNYLEATGLFLDIARGPSDGKFSFLAQDGDANDGVFALLGAIALD